MIHGTGQNIRPATIAVAMDAPLNAGEPVKKSMMIISTAAQSSISLNARRALFFANDNA